MSSKKSVLISSWSSLSPHIINSPLTLVLKVRKYKELLSKHPRMLQLTIAMPNSHMSIHVHIHVHVCIGACTYRGQRSISSAILNKSPLSFFETESFTEHEAHGFSKSGWPARPRGPPVSASEYWGCRHRPLSQDLLKVFWETVPRFSCLYGEHASQAITLALGFLKFIKGSFTLCSNYSFRCVSNWNISIHRWKPTYKR